MLGLIDSCGNTQFVPMEWTDRSPATWDQLLEDPKPILNARFLLSLVRIVERSTSRSREN
jgi:hypothetical protein